MRQARWLEPLALADVEVEGKTKDEKRVAQAPAGSSGRNEMAYDLARRVPSDEGVCSARGQGRRACRAATAGRRLRPGAAAPGRAGRGASEPPRAQRAPRRHGVV